MPGADVRGLGSPEAEGWESHEGLQTVTERDALLEAGRAAVESGAWEEAFEALTSADELEGLEPDDLELLWNAASFTARPEVGLAAAQRAFAAVRGTDPQQAALLALRIALPHFARGAGAVGLGWSQQAADLLVDQEECEATAWLAWLNGHSEDELDASLRAADQLIELSRRVGTTDVEALGLLRKGQLLTHHGRPEEGGRLIDPVMALAVSGALGPSVSGMVYCGTISTYADTGDLDRAWEWTNEVARCGLNTDYPGDCRIHRAEILRVRGDWAKAEVELASVCDLLDSWDTRHTATAHHELGILSLRRGDLTAAGEAFAYCRSQGHTSLPGMALLELAQGNAEVAVVQLREALTQTASPVDRLKLLPATVEALLADAKIDEAAEMVKELRALSELWPVPLHLASSAHADGALALAQGDLSAATQALTRAIDWWRKVPAPYEQARSQLLRGLAEEGAAQTVLVEAALETFERLGAVIDVDEVLRHLGRSAAVERETLALMFTDIEGSTKMLSELGDAAWLEVLRRHDDCLRELFARHGGEVLTGTGDGFFVGFPTADGALDCAADIHQTVQDLRVRIGVHFAEVNRDSGGYSGRGVHEAARISALGAGGDIVVSAATLERATTARSIRETQTVVLKGLPGETQISFLD